MEFLFVWRGRLSFLLCKTLRCSARRLEWSLINWQHKRCTHLFYVCTWTWTQPEIYFFYLRTFISTSGQFVLSEAWRSFKSKHWIKTTFSESVELKDKSCIKKHVSKCWLAFGIITVFLKVAPALQYKFRTTERATLFQATIVAGKDFTASQRDQFVCAVVKKGGAGTESVDVAWSSEYWATSPVVMDQSFSLCKHCPHTSLAAVQEIRPQVGRKNAFEINSTGTISFPWTKQPH